MDRRKFITLVGGGVVAVAAGYFLYQNFLGGAPARERKLSLYSWEEEIFFDPPITYEGKEYDNIVDLFKQFYPEIELTTSYYGDQDKMTADLLAGKKVDVIAPCVDYIPVLYENDLLEEIDTGMMENWNKMFSVLRDVTGVKIDGKVVFIPTNYGTEAIDYRRDLFDQNGLEYPQSWLDFFQPWNLGFDKLDNKKRILMPDDYKIGIAMAALALGYNLDSNNDGLWELTDEQLQNCKELLIEQKPYVLKYSEEVDSDMPNLMANGDIFMSLGWAPETLELQDEGYDVVYLLPEEGPLVFLCGNSIVKGTENYEDAVKLVDFYAGPIIQRYFAEEYWYGISNEEVVNQLKEDDPDLVESLLLDKPMEALGKGHFEYPFAEGQEELWSQIWEEVLSA